MKFLISLAILIVAYQSNAQVSLSCKHIPLIQKGFLDQHINSKKYSDKLEQRVIDQFIKRLDPSKLYFTQSDVKAAEKQMKGVLKRTQQMDCSAFMKVYATYQNKVADRLKFVKSFLDDKYVFDKTVSLNLDASARPYSKTVDEINDFHKKYLHFQISNYLATDLSLDKAKEKVIKNYERISKKIAGLSEDEKFSDYLDSFARALDPHSSYFSKDALENFEIQMKLSLEGIGATLRWEDGFTVVESLVEGGSAAVSNQIKPKDKIIAVSQGEGKPMEDVIDMDLGDVVKKIRGKKGTPVHLTILRKIGDKTERIVAKLKRDKINLEDEAAAISYHKRKIGSSEKLIGLVNLPSFYSDGRSGGRSSAKDLEKLLAEAKAKKVDGLILDLSSNGGGSLDDAVKISGLFYKTGNVVKQSSSNPMQPAIVLADVNPEVNYDGPLVILTSRVSASASEIVSGTLQDYKRAVVVGADHTFGKGTVQSVVTLPSIGALKVTVGMFFVPGGYSTQHRGVISDISFPSALETDEIGEKTYDYSLPPQKLDSFISSSAFVTEGKNKWRILDKKTIDTLKESSDKRVAANAEFIKIKEDLEKANKRGKIISLSEVMKEKEETKKDETDGPLSKKDKQDKYVKRPEIQEAMNIVSDLISIQSDIPLTQTPTPAKTATSKVGS
jgi:carboxyl-terminal processing protease